MSKADNSNNNNFVNNINTVNTKSNAYSAQPKPLEVHRKFPTSRLKAIVVKNKSYHLHVFEKKTRSELLYKL